MAKKYLGRVTIRVDGISLDSRPGATLMVGGIRRNPIVNDNGNGFAEEKVLAQIDCELGMKVGDSFEFVRNMTNGTCVFECDTGQQFIVREAFTQDPYSLTGNEGGRVKFTFCGEPAEEVVA